MKLKVNECIKELKLEIKVEKREFKSDRKRSPEPAERILNFYLIQSNLQLCKNEDGGTTVLQRG